MSLLDEIKKIGSKIDSIGSTVGATPTTDDDSNMLILLDNLKKAQDQTNQSLQTLMTAVIGNNDGSQPVQGSNGGVDIHPVIDNTNPFSDQKLWIDQNSDVKKFIATNPNDLRTAQFAKIADQPSVAWLGDWDQDVNMRVINALKDFKDQNALPVFCIYNIPGRDNGNYSAGGAKDQNAYYDFIRKITGALANTKAVVILEPDAIPLTEGLDNDQKKQIQYDTLSHAIDILKNAQNTVIYLDIGHPNWLDKDKAIILLKKCGIDKAFGFTLNIANFVDTPKCLNYGDYISQAIGNKHYIVDTARNGNGSSTATGDASWCNPDGMAIGEVPSVKTGHLPCDAYLWIKFPSGSDGSRNGAPQAGQFYPDYLLKLIENSKKLK